MLDVKEVVLKYSKELQLRYTTTPEVVPKRLYKNPVLQRLSNRWYGYKETGNIILDLRTVAKQDSVRILDYEPQSVFVGYSDPKEKTEVKFKTLTFPVVGYRCLCPKYDYHAYERMAVETFRQQIPSLLFKYLKETEQI